MGISAKSHGIIIRKINYSNTSVIVHLLTPSETILHVIARGAKKPKSAFSGKLELFSQILCDYIVSAKSGMHTLKECSLVHHSCALTSNIELFYLASFMSDVVAAISWDPTTGERVYTLFKSILNSFDRAPQESASLLLLFIMRILKIQGVLPDITCSAKTGTPLDGMVVPVLYPQSGFVKIHTLSPSEHRKNTPIIHLDYIKQAYSALFQSKDDIHISFNIPQKQVMQLNTIFLGFLREEVGRKIKTEKFLKLAGLIEE